MKHCQLTERDINILSFLHQHKVATTKQILRDVFKANTGTARKRLQILRLNGFIESVGRDEDGDKSIIYSISKRSFNFLARFYPEMCFIKSYRSSSIVHDLRLLEIRKALTSKKLVTGYWPENVLKTSQVAIEDRNLQPFRSLNVDAVVKLENSQGKKIFCAVEYEASLKSKSEYLAKMSEIYSSPFIRFVLYITSTEEIEARLKKSEQEFAPKGEKKIYFAQFKKVTIENSVLTFTNQDSHFLEVY